MEFGEGDHIRRDGTQQPNRPLPPVEYLVGGDIQRGGHAVDGPVDVNPITAGGGFVGFEDGYEARLGSGGDEPYPANEGGGSGEHNHYEESVRGEAPADDARTSDRGGPPNIPPPGGGNLSGEGDPDEGMPTKIILSERDNGRDVIEVNNVHPDQTLVAAAVAKVREHGFDPRDWVEIFPDKPVEYPNRRYFVDRPDDPTLYAKHTELSSDPHIDDPHPGTGGDQMTLGRVVRGMFSHEVSTYIAGTEGFAGLRVVEPVVAVGDVETASEAVIYPFQPGREVRKEEGEDGETARADRVGDAIGELLAMKNIDVGPLGATDFRITSGPDGDILHFVDMEQLFPGPQQPADLEED